VRLATACAPLLAGEGGFAPARRRHSNTVTDGVESESSPLSRIAGWKASGSPEG
jgi:hypothetical protein